MLIRSLEQQTFFINHVFRASIRLLQPQMSFFVSKVDFLSIANDSSTNEFLSELS